LLVKSSTIRVMRMYYDIYNLKLCNSVIQGKINMGITVQSEKLKKYLVFKENIYNKIFRLY
jgi:hypothetical protein